MRKCQWRDLGRMAWIDAWALQRELVSQRKQGLIPDQFLTVEHPHVITMGRNGNESNLLAPPEILERTGIAFHQTNRGGDVTYHGPGQLVGYPIFDLREWKRDVVGYVRALEQVLIDSLGAFGLQANREAGLTGVWISGKKVAAIGVHISRWVTSHGFALNLSTDLDYFRYIVPCGLHLPVTSMAELGVRVDRQTVAAEIHRHLARLFFFDTIALIQETEKVA